MTPQEQEIFNSGYIQGAAEMGHRFQNIIRMVRENHEKLTEEVTKLIGEASEEIKISTNVINHVSCVVCPLNKDDECPHRGNSFECVTAKREYFRGVGGVEG